MFVPAPHWNPHQPSTDGEPLNPFLSTPPADVKSETPLGNALIDSLVDAARSLHDTTTLQIVITENMDVHTEDTTRLSYAVSDGAQQPLLLGNDDAPQYALCALARLFGNAMDRLAVACRDTRLVALYTESKRLPEGLSRDGLLNGLWGVMTVEERTQADVSRAFDQMGRPDRDELMYKGREQRHRDPAESHC